MILGIFMLYPSIFKNNLYFPL